jgi:protein-disulfide isomerase
MEPSTQPTSPAVPIAIISGFAMIAVAIFFTNQNSAAKPVADQTNPDTAVMQSGVARAVDSNDYIRGNPNAPILMVEYSDYDCPYCKQYHTTMNQIMDEYGVTGKLAWVYRQLPIGQLHPNAPKISEAALCVGSLGGNEAFWNFTDMIFDRRDINSQTNVTKLPEYAATAGVKQTDYAKCMSDGDMKDTLDSSIEDAFNAGAQGTPYTILIVGDQQAVISGAQPYDTVKGIIENLLDQLDGNFDIEAAETTNIPTNNRGVPVLE